MRGGGECHREQSRWPRARQPVDGTGILSLFLVTLAPPSFPELCMFPGGAPALRRLRPTKPLLSLVTWTLSRACRVLPGQAVDGGYQLLVGSRRRCHDHLPTPTAALGAEDPSAALCPGPPGARTNGGGGLPVACGHFCSVPSVWPARALCVSLGPTRDRNPGFPVVQDPTRPENAAVPAFGVPTRAGGAASLLSVRWHLSLFFLFFDPN